MEQLGVEPHCSAQPGGSCLKGGVFKNKGRGEGLSNNPGGDCPVGRLCNHGEHLWGVHGCFRHAADTPPLERLSILRCAIPRVRLIEKIQ